MKVTLELAKLTSELDVTLADRLAPLLGNDKGGGQGNGATLLDEFGQVSTDLLLLTE